MSNQRRMNLHRLWSLFAFAPFLAVLLYPPWQERSGRYVHSTRDWLWDGPLFYEIALGQWALELGATFIIAAIVVGVVFYVTPHWRENDA